MRRVNRNTVVNIFAVFCVLMGALVWSEGDEMGVKDFFAFVQLALYGVGLFFMFFKDSYVVVSTGDEDDVNKIKETDLSEKYGNNPPYMDELCKTYSRKAITYTDGKTYCVIDEKDLEGELDIVKSVCPEGDIRLSNTLKYYAYEFLSDKYFVVEKVVQKRDFSGHVTVDITVTNKDSMLSDLYIYMDYCDGDGVVCSTGYVHISDLQPNTKYMKHDGVSGIKTLKYARITKVEIRSSEKYYSWRFD